MIENALLGSSVQPAIFTLQGGSTVQLGTVVADAFAKSTLTVDEWNALDNQAREDLIAAQVATLPLSEATAGSSTEETSTSSTESDQSASPSTPTTEQNAGASTDVGQTASSGEAPTGEPQPADSAEQQNPAPTAAPTSTTTGGDVKVYGHGLLATLFIEPSHLREAIKLEVAKVINEAERAEHWTVEELEKLVREIRAKL